MKKGIIYGVFMSILLLGVVPSVNQNVITLYNEQSNTLPNLLKLPNDRKAPIEENTGFLEQPILGPSSVQRISDYIEGTRIEILGDNGFGPSNYNFQGSGIQSDPYLIDGYSISDTAGPALIYIKDTSVFFRITNCDLNGQNFVGGISLVNVSHGLIENNQIKECATGISLNSSNLNNICKNVILNSTIYGISLTGTISDVCNNNIISQNTVFNASIAINLGSGSYPNVNNNSINWNNFFKSRDQYLGHAIDKGVNNSFQNNHWDDWIGADANSDGFVDMPRSINPNRMSLFYDGSNDYANLANFALNDTFSFEFWVTFRDLMAGQCIIGKHDSGGVNIFLLFITNGNLVIYDRTGTFTYLGSIVTGWHHFAVIINQDVSSYDYHIYQDGKLFANGTQPVEFGNTASDRAWVLGQDWDGSTPTDHFNGFIDEVRFLNRSLSGSEIYNDYISSIHGHYPARSETVAWYHFDEQGGTVVPDSSGNGYDGNIINGPSWDSYPLGLFFDGSSDYANLANFPLNDSFSIEFWVNVLDPTSGECIIGKHNDLGSINIFILFASGGNLIFYDRNYPNYVNLGPITSGWQYFTLVFKQDIVSYDYFVYKNGLLFANGTQPVIIGNDPTDRAWVLGQDWDGSTPTDHFRGSISGLRFVNRSLSAQEIYEDYIYPNSYYPQRTETVAWYYLTGPTNPTGNIVADYSGNGYNGTLHGYSFAHEAWKEGILNFDTSPRVAPIWINDNDDFAAFSSSGNGTIDSPYILENYYLISDSTILVQIYNTTAHFVIKNSFLDGMANLDDAMIIDNVSNGLLVNNHFTNVGESCIELFYTHHFTLSSNVFSYSHLDGPPLIASHFSHNNSYFNNTLRNADEGMYFRYSNNNTVSFNRIYDIRMDGITLATACNNNTFYGNSISNLEFGSAITLSSSDYNNFTWNEFSDNRNFGINLIGSQTSSDYNIVEWNYFIDNLALGSGGTTQAYDGGINNIFKYNYWNNHTSPDTAPADGIVDTPYLINGVGNQDPYPRALLGPNVTIVSPVAQTFTVPKIRMNITGNALQYWYYIEGMDTENQTGITVSNRTIPDGTYTLHVYGNDMFGYIIHKTVSFTIDFFDIISPLEQEYGGVPINILFSGYATHYWYYIEDVDLQNQTWTSNIDRIFLAGSYTLHAYGNDSEGIIIHHSVSITVETTPPIIDIPSPQNITYYQNTIDLIYTITDYDTFTIYLDGTAIPGTSGITIEFPGVEDEGSHNITIIAVDHLGNIARTTRLFSIYIPPALNIDSPLSTSYETGSITITLSGDALHYWYYISEVDSANITWITDVSRNLPEGTYTLHAYGNGSNGAISHQSVTFTIDTVTTTISSSTTLSTTSLQTTTTTAKKGSFPNLIAIFLSILPLVILNRKYKKK